MEKDTNVGGIPRDERSLKQLKGSYEMYEKTIKETERMLRSKLNEDGTKKYTEDDIKKEIDLIREAQNDVVSQYVMLGGSEDEIKKKTRKKTVTTDTDSISKMATDLMKTVSEQQNKIENTITSTETRLEQQYIPTKGTYSPQEAFDVIPLPSKGEGYKDKISKVSVSFLTAYDENMIVSPNLYRDNLIVDYLLQEKLLSQEIAPIDLLEGDRDAIILFLRANGYGNEYPITATDDATGIQFDTVVDLSKLKYKEFNLVGDSNGWFPFTLPYSGKEVKFRFPTHRDNLLLEKMQNMEDNKTKKTFIKQYVDILDSFIESDNELKKEDKVKVRQAIRDIEYWGNTIDDENTLKFNHSLTNKLNLLLMSVDGITDRNYISDFIKKMSTRDSYALRKYMAKNEPGIDYTITVERPKSLGGGSFETFLQLDSLLFLNIAE